MAKYINKDTIVAEIERCEKICEDYMALHKDTISQGIANAKRIICQQIIEFINTLEVEEIETPVIPKHSYFEHIYHCGSEPMWKIGDVLAVYELYSDHEGEYVYGKITDIKMDENEDWLYTFENGEELYENMLISDEAYKKN